MTDPTELAEMTDLTDHRGRGAIDRRHVLAVGLGTAGLAGLAACGGTTGTTGGPYGGGAAAPATTGPSAAGATPLIALADVPVGSAASATTADGKPVIVSQPTEGTAVAFSAICTHRGCTVAPAGSELKCPCHGSVYKASDGSNVSGPAPRPLDKVAVKVVDGQVVPA
jgi:nitrite reductase/ring-hydroxylating ferredoxin subunit